MVEVARHQRHVDVARLADRLAVVERLQHGEEARVLLHEARERVEHLRALEAGLRAPLRRTRLAAAVDRSVDIFALFHRERRQHFAVGRVLRFDRVA